MHSSYSEIIKNMLVLGDGPHGFFRNFEFKNEVIIEQDNYNINLGNYMQFYNGYLTNHMLSTSHHHDIVSNGAALNIDKSKVKTFGESIERASAVFDENSNHYIYGNFNELSQNYTMLNPKHIIGHDTSKKSNHIRNLHTYTHELDMKWSRGTNIITNETMLMPTQKVYLYGFNDAIIDLWISTGLASHTSYEEAVISGLEEVIERDSFMLSWIFKREPTKINIDVVSNPELQKTYGHMMHHLIGEDELYIILLETLDFTYSVLALLVNRLPGAWHLSLGRNVDLNPEIAVLGALEELGQLQGHNYRKRFIKEGTSNPSVFSKNMNYYNNDLTHFDNLNFFLYPSKTINLSELPNYEQPNAIDTYQYYIQAFKQLS